MISLLGLNPSYILVSIFLSDGMAAMLEPTVKRAAGVIHCLLWLAGIESPFENECPKEFAWKEKHMNSSSSTLLVCLILMKFKFNCNDKPLKIQISNP